MKKRLTLILSIISFLLIVSCSTKEQKEINMSDSKVIDWEYQIAYQRGIEAMNWAMPAVSMISLRKGNFSLGGHYNTVYWISQTPTPLAEAITPNNQTPYATLHLSTKNGPVVLDIPPASKRTAIFGSAPMSGRFRLRILARPVWIREKAVNICFYHRDMTAKFPKATSKLPRIYMISMSQCA